MSIGFHLSIKKGIPYLPIQANKLEYTNFQFFTRSSRSWKYKVLSSEKANEFKENCTSLGFKTKVIHLPYLPNFATNDPEIRTKSLDSLIEEVKRADLLDVNFLVIHIGSHKGIGLTKGIKLVADAVNHGLEESSQVKILLETSAGYKNSVGSKFEELESIIEEINIKSRVGICFDTCHVFAAGYDLRTETSVDDVLNEFDSKVGLTKLKLIHLNDSKGLLGGGLDRHENIGRGNIGLSGFEALLTDKRIYNKPIILETPNTDIYGDKDNFDLVNKIVSKTL
ncbi:MAG: deoxyribonuclease IV [Candidatus Heimdallarchaeota archaeon]|nr:deoxyribonuclease IV [Candidatus Heimdallarchaeota archaeon]